MDGIFTPKYGKKPEIDVLIIAGFKTKLFLINLLLIYKKLNIKI